MRMSKSATLLSFYKIVIPYNDVIILTVLNLSNGEPVKI